MYIPALNEIRRQTGSEKPKYPENPGDRRYMILYPEDYDGHGIDVEGNIALLVDAEQAREIKRLAEEAIEQLEDGDRDGDKTGQVTIDREVLETLRSFASGTVHEYGYSTTIWNALIDSGVALGLTDPTPPGDFERFDPEGMRKLNGDEAVDALREKWARYGPSDGGHDE